MDNTPIYFDKIREEFEICDGWLDYDSIRDIPEFSEQLDLHFEDRWVKLKEKNETERYIVKCGDEIVGLRSNEDVNIIIEGNQVELYKTSMKKNESKEFFFPMMKCGLVDMKIISDRENVTIEAFYHFWGNKQREIISHSKLYSVKYNLIFDSCYVGIPSEELLNSFRTNGENIKG